MKNLINSLLDLIYKKKCYICKSSKYSLKICPECYDKLEFYPIGANRIINGVNVYVAGYYNKELQKIIRGIKYHRQKDLAYYLGKFMYEYFSKSDELKNKDFQLVPVPLHKNRIRTRKYNHMELVCEEFSKFSGFETNFELIKRIKDTKPQYKLSRKERLINLDGAFEVNKTQIPEKPVLIMDDICTTGSTFEEIIKVLSNCGIKEIVCFAASTPL